MDGGGYGAALREAAMKGDLKELQAQISSGIPIDTRSPPNFTTVLHIVTAKGYIDCVKYLLENGADLEAVDANGNTPLHLATGNGRTCIVELLLSRAASTFVHNTEGKTPFDLAKRSNDSITGAAVLACYEKALNVAGAEKIKPSWEPDESTKQCVQCGLYFTMLQRRHHCRSCGKIHCNACTSQTSVIPKFGFTKPVRVCDQCLTELNRFEIQFEDSYLIAEKKK
mmetsp:Transcript_52783/g.132775  ORF Transcript_52783/g.132775 Transcript_52783/m.132775 type:complete len:226 (-) Transcript_52783:48-725(-)|eukprot:CAMPEP_0177647738 /NCGR_PEP_ID=MMETSP0447-20121125/10460_1 /TAXON_ID=0 /ORGANISM="Stygamoeba regulata, Strain BSH-02190019" /LENGTH=225 /DNA_ID=CAMNT_0019150343 /DNA_START=95 /DNA_END=772 /DNA_ORIENTATION=+